MRCAASGRGSRLLSAARRRCSGCACRQRFRPGRGSAGGGVLATTVRTPAGRLLRHRIGDIAPEPIEPAGRDLVDLHHPAQLLAVAAADDPLDLDPLQAAAGAAGPQTSPSSHRRRHRRRPARQSLRLQELLHPGGRARYCRHRSRPGPRPGGSAAGRPRGPRGRSICAQPRPAAAAGSGAGTAWAATGVEHPGEASAQVPDRTGAPSRRGLHMAVGIQQSEARQAPLALALGRDLHPPVERQRPAAATAGTSSACSAAATRSARVRRGGIGQQRLARRRHRQPDRQRHRQARRLRPGRPRKGCGRSPQPASSSGRSRRSLEKRTGDHMVRRVRTKNWTR